MAQNVGALRGDELKPKPNGYRLFGGLVLMGNWRVLNDGLGLGSQGAIPILRRVTQWANFVLRTEEDQLLRDGPSVARFLSRPRDFTVAKARDPRHLEPYVIDLGQVRTDSSVGATVRIAFEEAVLLRFLGSEPRWHELLESGTFLPK